MPAAVRTEERFTVGDDRLAEEANRRAHGAQSTLHAVVGVVATFAMLVVPLQLSEVSVYKVGVVLIFAVAAMGLHVLVNWTGELSLAHATFVGFPAILVAKLSGDHDLSPVLLLPVGVLAGAVLGAVVGLPALRAKGVQVALVTLAAGVAVDRFFFTKPWFVGSTGVATVGDITLGPIELTTSTDLYPLLWALAVVAGGGLWLLYRSKVARAFAWVRTEPEAAAAFGIPVASYRILAYALAGALAGLAGGMTAMWVERVSPEAFTLTHSFTYLVVVVLAGRGFIGGVAIAAASLEGGRLFLSGLGTVFDYLGPISLIATLTTYKTGLNGFGRQLGRRFVETKPGRALAARVDTRGNHMSVHDQDRRRPPISMPGIGLVASGAVAITVAWALAAGTDDVSDQAQLLLSGGIGGLALVVIGVGAIVVREVRALAGRSSAPESHESADGGTRSPRNGPRPIEAEPDGVPVTDSRSDGNR